MEEALSLRIQLTPRSIKGHLERHHRLVPFVHRLLVCICLDAQATKKAMEDALSPRNATCLSCYGAEEKIGQCCNTCEEVRAGGLGGWAFASASRCGVLELCQCE